MIQVTLGHMIKTLGELEGSQVLPFTFGNPHSNRGWYEKLGLEMQGEGTVQDLVQILENCVGEAFEGYKGGHYGMDVSTEACVSQYGYSGWNISKDFWDSYIAMMEEYS
jgi:hypothetical protein